MTDDWASFAIRIGPWCLVFCVGIGMRRAISEEGALEGNPKPKAASRLRARRLPWQPPA
jgi:hypothetical protein